MCSICKHVTLTSDKLTSPVIEVELAGNTVQSCIDASFSVTKLTGSERAKCTICNTRTDRENRIALKTAPEVLIVKL